MHAYTTQSCSCFLLMSQVIWEMQKYCYKIFNVPFNFKVPSFLPSFLPHLIEMCTALSRSLLPDTSNEFRTLRALLYFSGIRRCTKRSNLGAITCLVNSSYDLASNTTPTRLRLPLLARVLIPFAELIICVFCLHGIS